MVTQSDSLAGAPFNWQYECLLSRSTCSHHYPSFLELDDVKHDIYSRERKVYTKTFQGTLTTARTNVASKENNPVNATPKIQAVSVNWTVAVNKPTLYFHKSKFLEFSGARRENPGF